ncbi:MAG: PEP/pyruvate-binding domain-containing protein [Nocardioidaceae bacterium]
MDAGARGVNVLEIGEAPVGEVGGKAAGLSALLRLGLPVPPALVVPATARGVLADPGSVVARLGEPLAVRSSGLHEDEQGRSAAGQYESLMGVTRGDLVSAVQQVYRSASSDRVLAYGSGAPDAAMAVIVQRQVPATRAGVAFSREPMTGSDLVVVEAVFGHGEQLVSGQVNPDRFLVDPDGSVTARLAVHEGPFRALRTLRDDEVRSVAELTRRAAAGFGCPVDVEFCFEGRQLWLVQCRPITTL